MIKQLTFLVVLSLGSLAEAEYDPAKSYSLDDCITIALN